MKKTNTLNESYLLKIEEKAKLKFNVIKMGENDYLRPENVFNTYSINNGLNEKVNVKKEDKQQYAELLKLLDTIEVEDKNVITVRAIDNTLGEGVLLEIMNLSKCFDKSIQTLVSGDYNISQRKLLMNILADKFKDKNSVQIIVYANYTFKMLEELVRDY